MVKPYICHKKNCWSTDFSVLKEAALREEEHFNENLMQRATQHSHKEENKDSNEEVINKAITQIKTEEFNESSDYQEKNIISDYGIDDQDKKLGSKEKSFTIAKNTANMGHDHENLEVSEFLYEQTPTGGIRQTPLILSLKGQLFKKGILLKYLENKFDTYR